MQVPGDLSGACHDDLPIRCAAASHPLPAPVKPLLAARHARSPLDPDRAARTIATGVSSAYISSPSANGFHVGPFFVHAYGLAYVFAVAAAILVTRELWRRDGGDPNLPQEIALWASRPV